MVEAQPAEAGSKDAQLPKLGKNWKYTLSAKEGDEKVLVPLTKVSVKSVLQGPMATVEVELSYVNPTQNTPLECTYMFPLEKTSFLAKLEACIDDRTIETKIKEKEKAQEQY